MCTDILSLQDKSKILMIIRSIDIQFLRDEYKLMRRWIAAGTPFGKPSDPGVTRISVVPEHRVMSRQNKQQFAVSPAGDAFLIKSIADQPNPPPITLVLNWKGSPR